MFLRRQIQAGADIVIQDHMVRVVLIVHIKNMNMWIMNGDVSFAAHPLTAVGVPTVRRRNTVMATGATSASGAAQNQKAMGVRTARAIHMKNESPIGSTLA